MIFPRAFSRNIVSILQDFLRFEQTFSLILTSRHAFELLKIPLDRSTSSLLQILVTRLISLGEQSCCLIAQEGEGEKRRRRTERSTAGISLFPRLTYSGQPAEINVAVHEINPSQFKSPRESLTKG